MANGALAGDRTELLLNAWALERSGELLRLRSLLEPLADRELVDEPELGLLLMKGYVLTQMGAEARRMEALLAPVMALRGNDLQHRKYLNWQCFLLVREGALSEAEHRFRELEWMGSGSGDDIALASALHGIGVIADIRCDYETSLRMYERALSVLRRGKSRNAGVLYHHLGMTFRQLGLYPQAFRHFEKALTYELAEADLALVDLERAVLHAVAGQPGVAAFLAERALERQRTLGTPAGIADALRVLAMARADAGHAAEALPLLEQALERVPREEPLIEAEVHEELARVHTYLGNTLEALNAEAAAAALYTRMEAPRRAERMRLRLAVVELDGAP
jgi:tetratricopeptide (TPR) repeat protein